MAHCVVEVPISRKHSVQQNRVGHTALRGVGRPIKIIVIMALRLALRTCRWEMSLINIPTMICRNPIQIFRRRAVIYELGSEISHKPGLQTHTPVQQATAFLQDLKCSAANPPGRDGSHSDYMKNLKRSLWCLMLWGLLARSGGVVKGALVGDHGTWLLLGDM